RQEREPADEPALERPEEGASVAARLRTLGDDDVDAEPLELDRLRDGRGRAEDARAGLPDLLERRRTEGEAEDGNPLFNHDRELGLGQAGGRRLRGRGPAGQTELRAVRR